MPTRAHLHEDFFPNTAEELFALLHTPSAIRGWWGASRAIVIAEPGGMWMATWGEVEDAPEYVSGARILAFEPPKRLVLGDYKYRAKAGPLPFEADFVTEFTTHGRVNGCVLRVMQDGFPCEPAADAFYAACEKGWHDTFAGIHAYLRQKH